MDGGFSAIESTDVDGTAEAHEVGGEIRRARLNVVRKCLPSHNYTI